MVILPRVGVRFFTGPTGQAIRHRGISTSCQQVHQTAGQPAARGLGTVGPGEKQGYRPLGHKSRQLGHLRVGKKTRQTVFSRLWIYQTAPVEKYFAAKSPKVLNNDRDDLPAFGKKLAREVHDVSGARNFAQHGEDHDMVLKHNQWPRAVQSYLATISYVDAQVGRLMRALDSSEHAKNTIVVLWGDHGWHLGEKEHWRKHALWETTTRTTLITRFGPFRWKPMRPPGQPHRSFSIIGRSLPATRTGQSRRQKHRASTERTETTMAAARAQHIWQM